MPRRVGVAAVVLAFLVGVWENPAMGGSALRLGDAGAGGWGLDLPSSMSRNLWYSLYLAATALGSVRKAFSRAGQQHTNVLVGLDIGASCFAATIAFGKFLLPGLEVDTNGIALVGQRRIDDGGHGWL